MKLFIILSMIFCHIIDDYKLQAGVLNNLKQRKWWQENSPDSLYKYDYLVGLVMHSMSWSFMIHLPVALYYGLEVGIKFVLSFIVNAAIHSVVDHLKANAGLINLIVDQVIHIAQILITAVVLLLV